MSLAVRVASATFAGSAFAADGSTGSLSNLDNALATRDHGASLGRHARSSENSYERKHDELEQQRSANDSSSGWCSMLGSLFLGPLIGTMIGEAIGDSRADPRCDTAARQVTLQQATDSPALRHTGTCKPD